MKKARELRSEMTCRSVCNGIILVFLLAACIVLFILHSLYFILSYAESSVQTRTKTSLETQLFMPAIVLCNRMPFSQDGINSVSSNIRQDSSIRYLREWTDPSMRESSAYFPASTSYMQQGSNILMQYISPVNRNQSIQRMEYQCQSVINSCTYQEVQLSSYDCCKNLLYSLPTLNGMCWLIHDKSMWQNTTGVNKQLHIILQISRNSWYSSSYMPNHPGVDVYLKENGDDVIRLSSELEVPIRLNDKKGVRLRMHKERKGITRRSGCGQSLSDALSSDQHAYESNRTNLLLCNIMVAIKYCNCHPLLAEMLPMDVVKFRDFSLMINSTTVCSVEQYDNCTRQYMELSKPSTWDTEIPRYLAGYTELDKCRSDNHLACAITSYPGTIDQYDLPSEYQNTQDFVSRLTLEYTTMEVTELLESKDPNLYEMLSYIGYNLALWFSVGHILWSLYSNCCNTICPEKRNKVSPLHDVVISSPSDPVNLAPVEIPKTDGEAEQTS